MTIFRGLPPPVSGATFDIAAEGRIKNEVLSWSHYIFGNSSIQTTPEAAYSSRSSQNSTILSLTSST